ncbi:tRNA (cytidine(56)-2'-O)-methyltransferase [Candidatus Bathyarchaeota archaeon]|nr:tRNA (cytidine(56)-2'-O)-methyltransferase [Candidatus Bathyarchaeota archaeon]
MTVKILRLGHRPSRDKRVTTHLLLAARALGASGAIYTGVKDDQLEKRIQGINLSWGGCFEISFAKDWSKEIKSWKKHGKVVHLTMYGLSIKKVIEEIRRDESDKLIIVGGAKVPGEVFNIADWNVSITSQPHSEVSALAIFLHELFDGNELNLTFEKARLRIVPQGQGKKVIESQDNV